MEKHPEKYLMKDWKESATIERADGHKTSRVEAEFAYEGELSGPSKVSLLMHYHPDQTGTYIGWEHFEGTWQGKAATVVFRIDGSFDPKGVEARVSHEVGSGTGALDGLRLSYSIRFEGEGPYPFTLEVE